MTEKKKGASDPFLSELDALDDLAGGEEPTRIDHEPEPPPVEIPTKPGEMGKEILDLAPDIPVQLAVVMGRKDVTVKDLLSLRMGHVVELGGAASEAVELVAGGRVIARGELVQIDGKMGVRITRILK